MSSQKQLTPVIPSWMDSSIYGLKKESNKFMPNPYAAQEQAAQIGVNSPSAYIPASQPTTSFMGGYTDPTSILRVNQTSIFPEWGANKLTPNVDISANIPYESTLKYPGFEGMGLRGNQWDTSAGAADNNITPPATEFTMKDWADTKGLGGMALGGLNLLNSGINTWMSMDALNQQKKYQNSQIALQTADYKANAQDANRRLENSQTRKLQGQGINTTAGAGATQLANYMDKWRVNTNIG